MISATEARNLTKNSVKSHLKFIDTYIRDQITKDSSIKEVQIRQEPYASWLYSEANMDETAKVVVKELRTLGFKVKLFYCERQFVDMALVINWE